ncbi:MAG: hypothetical protein WCV56_06590 [Candidatus Omnitrophota bacterium]
MKNTGLVGVFIVFALFGFLGTQKTVFAATEDIHFSFDAGMEGWNIPEWTDSYPDYVAVEVLSSTETVKSGTGALEVVCDFPGNRWAAALVELNEDMDLSLYDTISADVYIPKAAPKGFFKARFAITAGIGWHFIEMREAVDLIPGKWVTLKVKIEKEETTVSEWRGRGDKRLSKHLDQVKKVAIRIEYNAAPPHTIGGKFKGSVFIDNVVISK